VLTRRIIACLDVDRGEVVKGTHFIDLRRIGDAVEIAARYGDEGADEIVMLDITATSDGRETTLSVIERAAERLFIPLTVGGGVRSVDDVGALLRAGADKVAINSAAVGRPQLLTEAAERYGSQCIVSSIDARKWPGPGGERRWVVVTHGGRRETALDAVEWAAECVRRGAGELLITSIDADGTRAGYDIELTRAIASRVPVPVVASGGAGGAADVAAVLRDTDAQAALVAGVLHDGTTTIAALKDAVRAVGLPVRTGAANSDRTFQEAHNGG